MFWANWLELEKHNDWGVRGKNDAVAALWDQGADGWEKRSQKEEAFAKKQAEALAISKEDTVLDVCCGTGPLTALLAARAKKVTALDFSENMLRFAKEKVQASGLKNVDFIQGNWNHMEPGLDYPKADIAVTRHSPAQGNILKFSRCARKYCYSLWMVQQKQDWSSLFGRSRGRWLKSEREEENWDERPDGRLYGINLHFNLLYELGAHPEIQYVSDSEILRGETWEKLALACFPGRTDEAALEYVKRNAVRQEDGCYLLERTRSISVMGWDPNEIRFDLLEEEIR
ncbi:methyltransferase domain-containing protein [Cuneatibacter sp. NSJ-177]|uniref:class I SAM-dependent methyltransferase n=1 Tax=Cuneatibacter sp. NSJ-177 TaxID=2931401 RepID=UPI001FD5D89E|nr:methyltransferase domain-containing protein [Cuneatibacter sp. NSJ-177]MCJ7835767.1 methyltransferase domain-containing protein [Cuneatibacter sp. NSJ-177]